METRHDSLAATLGATGLFSTLSPEELNSLASRAVLKRLHGGDMLFNEGDPCHGLHIVARGRVRIFKASSSGREQVLAINGAGDTVAELPVFDGEAYPASADAVGDTEIAFISRPEFRSYCLEHPEVALKVLSVVGGRLRRLVGIIEELSFTTVRQRLVSALVHMARDRGHKTADGIAFQLPASHQELAHELGTVRELVSRNLTRLQAEGLLEVDARQIVVKDLRALEALLD